MPKSSQREAKTLKNFVSQKDVTVNIKFTNYNSCRNYVFQIKLEYKFKDSIELNISECYMQKIDQLCIYQYCRIKLTGDKCFNNIFNKKELSKI